MRFRSIIWIAIIIFSSVQVAKTQERTLEDLEVVLTAKLCEYVTWASDSSNNFRIGIISDNLELRKRFKSLESSYKIKNKTIKTSYLNQGSNLSGLDLIFVDEKNLYQMSEISEIITSHNTLLISVNHRIAKEIMFNLLPDKQKGMVSFEFNKANLIFEGFEIHPDIIELRGSEIDVRDLYKQTKQRLSDEENKVNELQKKIDNQARDIKNQEKMIAEMNVEIGKKNVIIIRQTDSIIRKENILEQLNLEMASQHMEIRQKQVHLSELQNRMVEVNDSLESQKWNIYKQLLMLDSLNQEIKTKLQDLADKDTMLSEKENMISFRNNMIYLLIVMALLAFVFFLIALRSSKQNKRAQVILADQKEELETTLAKLTQAQEQLVHSEKMASLGILIAGIAHEINNPINFINSGIQGFNTLVYDLLKALSAYRNQYSKKKGNEEIDKLEEDLEIPYLMESSQTLLDSMKTGVDRTTAIIRSLRMFSHIDDESVSLVDIHHSIDLALTILVNQYKNRIEIIRNYGKLKPIYCMPGKLNQAFMNLITNAIHSIEDKGQIEITTSQDDKNVYITLKDNGCGIPDSIKNKVFDPFFTTKEVGTGTGMGLGIVFNIIKDHKGEISFNSTEGIGTTFYISLPVNPLGVIY